MLIGSSCINRAIQTVVLIANKFNINYPRCAFAVVFGRRIGYYLKFLNLVRAHTLKHRGKGSPLYLSIPPIELKQNTTATIKGNILILIDKNSWNLFQQIKSIIHS